MRKTDTLWTRNFTIITLGTVVSAISSVAMSFILSIVVFDQTGSTWLAALFSAASLVPGVVLPIFVAPVVDRVSRKNLVVRMDMCSCALYFLFGLYLWRAQGFTYQMFILFTLISNTIGSVYRLAYTALYPDLVPMGFEQKGYSVSSLIYPSVTALATPAATLVYTRFGLPPLFFCLSGLLIVAFTLESRIRVTEKQVRKNDDGLAGYGRELTEGLRYLKREKGVRSLYTYMAVGNGVYEGHNLMSMAYFQTTPGLGVAMYSFLISAETVGRMVGGLFHYFVQIPPERRYAITEKVYIIYETLDGIVLFFAYPLMIVIRFICGFLGVNSATLREAAVQRYLPADIRARVNAVFNVLAYFIILLFDLAAGAMGEWLDYRLVCLLLGAVCLAAIALLILRNRREIAKIYEVRPTEGEAADAASA